MMARQMCGPRVVGRAAHEQEAIDRVHACPRCQGFMVDDWLLDMAQGGCLWGTGRRCVNCGHIAPTGTIRGRASTGHRTADDEQDWHTAA